MMGEQWLSCGSFGDGFCWQFLLVLLPETDPTGLTKMEPMSSLMMTVRVVNLVEQEA
jgi:hypothetical protein